jgi:hypothetical protein
VLRPEWFEPELLRRESERDDEAGRDKRPLHPHIFLDAAAGVSEPDLGTGWRSTLDCARSEDSGRGFATRALQGFLQVEATRLLYARAASDNAASIRVLTKCGFRIVGEGREFAHGRNEETDEVVPRLDA